MGHGPNLGKNRRMAKVKIVKAEKKNGVTVTAWAGHPVYKWRVSFPDGAKRHSKGFKTKTGPSGANAFADEKRGDIDKDGNRHEAITDEERRAVMTFRELVAELPDSAQRPSLSKAVEHYSSTMMIRQRSRPVREISDKCLLKIQKKGAGKDHLSTVGRRLERFVEDYGDWLACDISEDIASEWLEDLALAPTTTNHFRADLNQLFIHALKLKAVTENVIEGIEKLETERDPKIFSVKDAEALLIHSPAEILPAVAIALFAGVRRAELGRLDWAEGDFEEGFIHIKKANAKGKLGKRKGRFIPIRPALKAWLMPYRQLRGPVMPSPMIYRSRLDEVTEASGIEAWPHNGLRHSFASYNLAAFENANSLALEMGHRDSDMIFENYRQAVTKTKALPFWQIMPAENGKVVGIKSA